jgi:hypothetical protein
MKEGGGMKGLYLPEGTTGSGPVALGHGVTLYRAVYGVTRLHRELNSSV